MKYPILVAALLLGLAQAAPAQIGGSDKSGDPRVKAALDELGLKYDVDSDGDYKLLLKLDSGRTQFVWVISHTESYGNLEIREVYSFGFKTGGDLSKELSQRLLQENTENKLGAWRLVGSGSTQVATYAVQIAATADANSLKQALKIVVVLADAMEKEVVGKDDL